MKQSACCVAFWAILQIAPYCNSFSTVAPKTSTNVNFENWIADQPMEVKDWKELQVEGVLPEYVTGTLIRNGGGMWSAPDQDDYFSHIFDGFAKISAYRFSQQRIFHQARFLEGSWYQKFRTDQRLAPSTGTGPILDASDVPKLGWWRTVQAVWNVCSSFDNAPVNIWDYDPSNTQPSKMVAALTDAPPRVALDMESMETLKSTTINPLAKGGKGYELLITAHPLYSFDTDDTYNIAVEIGLDTRVNLLRESPRGDRVVVGSFDMPEGEGGGIPYFHSFGLTKNYACILVQPLRINLDVSETLEKGFLRSMQHVDQTRVVVMDRTNGDILLDQNISEKVYFYHGISTSQSSTNKVSFRLCGYQTPDQLCGDHQFLRLEQARKGREWRNKIDKGGKFCDIVCDLDSGTAAVDWKTQGNQGFELPITRYSRAHGKSTGDRPIDSHPRYVYAFGAFANGSEDYDSWGLFKFDTEKDCQVDACFQQDSVYLSEPVFVPDPDGKEEDDGVLLCQAYFGIEDETKLLVLDAKTMEVKATAGTKMRTPMDFHGAWIPNHEQ